MLCSKLSKRKKRDQNALDNALSQLSKTVQEHDEMLADHLREAIKLYINEILSYFFTYISCLCLVTAKGIAHIFSSGMKCFISKRMVSEGKKKGKVKNTKNKCLLQFNTAFAEGSELISERLGNLQTLANDMQDHVPEETEKLIEESKPEARLQELRKACSYS
jgi:uncharacterized membrane-anchored protein YhcB (DUF1043 family)